MQMRMTTVAGIMLAASLTWAPTVFAQPGEGRPEPRPQRGLPPGDAPPPAVFDGTADDAKALLEERLVELRKRQSRLEQAIERIQRGDDLREVLGEMEAGNRPGQRPDAARRPLDGGMEPGPRAHDDGPRGQGSPGPLTPQERARVRELVREFMPLLDQRLEGMPPESADRLIARMAPRLREAESVRRRDPKLFQLRIQEIQGSAAVAEGVRNYRSILAAEPSNPQSPKLVEAGAKLRKLVEELHDVRLALQTREVEALGERLDGMKTDLDRKHSERDAMIDSMMAKIMDNTEFREIGPGDSEGQGPRRK